MSKELSLVFGDGLALQTEPGMARLYTKNRRVQIDLHTLGLMAEWLAVAWENVAGEEYRPHVITERGYVADPGVPVTVVTHEKGQSKA